MKVKFIIRAFIVA